MVELYNKFVEVIKIWQNGFRVYFVVIIFYDLNGGNVVELYFVCIIFKIFVRDGIIFIYYRN